VDCGFVDGMAVHNEGLQHFGTVSRVSRDWVYMSSSVARLILQGITLLVQPWVMASKVLSGSLIDEHAGLTSSCLSVRHDSFCQRAVYLPSWARFSPITARIIS
jgi:hypothetical protein